MSTAVPQPYFLPFDSFWSSPMGSIYLRKWKIHKNVICLKSFKLGFSSTWTKNFQIYKLGFEEAKEPENKLLTSYGSWRKQGSFRKTSTSASLTMRNPLTVVDHNKLWKFLKSWEYQTTLHVSWETCMQIKKQQLDPDMKPLTRSKVGKEYMKTVYCYPAYLTYMQSILYKMLGWMNHKLESRFWGEISTISDMQLIL